MLSPRSSLALAFCLLLLGPPAARADWSDPFDVSAPGSSRREARVAVDPSGATVVAWLARDGAASVLQARRIEADGTRGPILDLSQTGRIPVAPDVAMDAAGNATVVWSDRGTGTEEIVRARRITAAGALEPAIDLTGPGLTSKLPKVEAAPSGAVTVIWVRTPVGTVHLRRIDPAGGPGSTLDVSPPASGSADLAVDADGDAYLTWATFDGGDQLIHGRQVDAGGDLDDLDTLSDDEALSFTPHVALDGGGTPTVAWLREDDSIQLRRGLGATTDVAPAGTGDEIGDLAVDAAGNATVVWIGPSGSSRATFLRRLPATGAAGPVNDLWSGGDDHDPRLALDGAGTPTLIWGNSTPTVSTVRARTAPPGAPFGRRGRDRRQPDRPQRRRRRPPPRRRRAHRQRDLRQRPRRGRRARHRLARRRRDRRRRPRHRRGLGHDGRGDGRSRRPRRADRAVREPGLRRERLRPGRDPARRRHRGRRRHRLPCRRRRSGRAARDGDRHRPRLRPDLGVLGVRAAGTRSARPDRRFPARRRRFPAHRWHRLERAAGRRRHRGGRALPRAQAQGPHAREGAQAAEARRLQGRGHQAPARGATQGPPPGRQERRPAARHAPRPAEARLEA